MLSISDEEFEKMINNALDKLPEDRVRGLNNVAITYEDKPSTDQISKLKLRSNQSLFGLYEGIPLTKRAAVSGLFAGTAMTLPDKITIFKLPILSACETVEEVSAQVHKTLWHEIGHYYGLNHDDIAKREN